jgi:3-oxoacyl-[acyl-carrier-protein] synthase II
MSISNMAGGYLSVHYGLRGPNFCHVSACATGSHAIGESAHLIARGDADVMLAGGVEAPIIPITVSGFAAMKALSTQNDTPQVASRPFDKGRDGFVLGEGAGVVVLESLEHARNRGANVIAEILGYGSSADGIHIVQPGEEGDGPARCMTLAIESARINPSDVDYVNAHATSTPAGDPPEVRALERVFGEHLSGLPVSATKSMTGHLLGAAGAVEGIFTINAIADGLLPPTINLDDPDPACALDHVIGKARPASIRIGLSNSFGFGGTNATVIFGAVEAD